MPAPYPENRKAARRALASLFSDTSKARVIHYSCESFTCTTGAATPRITSIAVRRLDSAQTEIFSILREAEIQGIPPNMISSNYDRLEKAMLKAYFDYVRSQGQVEFLHWNMRDATFGFAALEHRFKHLGGKPWVISEGSRVDLSRLLLDIYGTDYIPHPRLEKLATLNHMTTLHCLSGEDEAKKFEEAEYRAVQSSTSRKADMISDIAERAFRGTLKTNSSWWVQNAGSFRAFWDWLVSNKSILFILALVALILTLAFGLVGYYLGTHSVCSHS